MNTTINEEIAHDCVQKLLEKLADERKLSSDQNVRITELEEQIGHMVDFVAAFELWLQSHILTEDDGDDYWVISPTEHSTHEDVRRQCRMLKAQHLGDDSEGE